MKNFSNYRFRLHQLQSYGNTKLEKFSNEVTKRQEISSLETVKVFLEVLNTKGERRIQSCGSVQSMIEEIWTIDSALSHEMKEFSVDFARNNKLRAFVKKWITLPDMKRFFETWNASIGLVNEYAEAMKLSSDEIENLIETAWVIANKATYELFIKNTRSLQEAETEIKEYMNNTITTTIYNELLSRCESQSDVYRIRSTYNHLIKRDKETAYKVIWSS